MPRRKPDIDYAAPGCYFITVVTASRRPRLGRLRHDGVHRSPIGEAVVEAWDAIGLHRPWISTPTFCLMPDHCHGLVLWDRQPTSRPATISTIMNGFKAEATRLARRAGALGVTEILWQRSFHVRLLTSSRAIQRAERYILDNPRRAWLRAQQVSPRPDGRGWDRDRD